MEVSKKKLVLITLITASIIIAHLWILQDFKFDSFSFYDFTKGMLTGIAGAASIVWLVSLFSVLRKELYSFSLIYVIRNNSRVQLGLGMSCLFIGIAITTSPLNELVFIIIASLLVGISIVFNINYLKGMGRTGKNT